MADFFQNGLITTLHNLSARPTAELEADLAAWGAERPLTLLIPTLFSELEGEALPRIRDAIAEMSYLDRVIIGLDRATEAEFEHARRFFEPLPQRHRILWNDGPRLRAVDAQLAEHRLAPPNPGKGRNVWFCLGYYLATSGEHEGEGAIALHDADVTTYEPGMVARLFYPVAHPTFGYAFAKGYYYRESEGRLNGRVARLLVTPLVRALRSTVGQTNYLDYIDSFRYPLAGEFAMRHDVVQNLRIPSDWGLEIGVLSEVYRRYPTSRLCQVDIADAYDHKHQPVSFDDPDGGLHRMGIDIAKAMFRKLAISGSVFSPDLFATIRSAYERHAADLIRQYAHDAEINGYSTDREAEAALVELFSTVVTEAGAAFLSDPAEMPFIPSWNRVESVAPSVLPDLAAAVEADHTATR